MILYWTVFAFFVLWLSIVTFVILKMNSRYNSLIKRTKKTNIDDILDVIIKKDELFEHEVAEIHKSLSQVISDSRFHYQKIGFMRFNPFERVGGEQSFVVSLLDGEKNGILLNFLYTRDGVRIYAKRVKNGTSEEYDLSAEEKEVIKKAN